MIRQRLLLLVTGMVMERGVPLVLGVVRRQHVAEVADVANGETEGANLGETAVAEGEVWRQRLAEAGEGGVEPVHPLPLLAVGQHALPLGLLLRQWNLSLLLPPLPGTSTTFSVPVRVVGTTQVGVVVFVVFIYERV